MVQSGCQCDASVSSNAWWFRTAAFLIVGSSFVHFHLQKVSLKPLKALLKALQDLLKALTDLLKALTDLLQRLKYLLEPLEDQLKPLKSPFEHLCQLWTSFGHLRLFSKHFKVYLSEYLWPCGTRSCLCRSGTLQTSTEA